MNELMERRAATASTAVARAVVGAIPVFRSKEGFAGKVQSATAAKADAENWVAGSYDLRGRSTFTGSHKAPLHPRTS
ncbi:hypothetical protein NB311A_18001 [Nitrobacter sp. Nb-311A]|nr:hypothetical protein NB311A_18001 [Nitrobacter sp. Nb-311A]